MPAADPGDDVDRPAEGVRAVDRRARSVEHLDPLDGRERDEKVEVVVAGLRVVDPDAVDQHHRLLEGAAAQVEVALDAARAAAAGRRPAARRAGLAVVCDRAASRSRARVSTTWRLPAALGIAGDAAGHHLGRAAEPRGGDEVLGRGRTGMPPSRAATPTRRTPSKTERRSIKRGTKCTRSRRPARRAARPRQWSRSAVG